ncbi:hypothetical protein E2320_007217, partial [Naja naja]
MACLKLTMPLFLLGALLVSQAFCQQPPCEVVREMVPRGSFGLDVEPHDYTPNDIYIVSITGAENASSVILQIVPSQNSGEGLWEEKRLVRCGPSGTVVQKNITGSGIRTRWISSSNLNVGSAEIRAFVTFANGTTLLQTRTLEKERVSTMSSSSISQPTSSTGKPTLLSNPSDGHRHINATSFHHNLAPSHPSTKGPHSSVSVTQASSGLLAMLQLLSILWDTSSWLKLWAQ